MSVATLKVFTYYTSGKRHEVSLPVDEAREVVKRTIARSKTLRKIEVLDTNVEMGLRSRWYKYNPAKGWTTETYQD